MQSDRTIRVLVWDENPPHAPKELYPDGIRGAVASGLQQLGGLHVETANLDDPDQGVSDERLRNTDVLVWWGHARHGLVENALADRIRKRVQREGMGFICLHSGHYSKPFQAILSAPGHLKGGWREANDTEEITVCAPRHPIAEGVEDFTIEAEEMYGSPFDVPPFETLVLPSCVPGGGE